MSKSFSKNKPSQQHKIFSQTCGVGDPLQHMNVFKLAKPPRRNLQQFMTTQPQYEQSNQQYNSLTNSRKGVVHKRNNSNYMNSSHQSQQYDHLAQFQNIKTHHGAPVKIRRYQSRSRVTQSQASNDIDQRFRQIERIMGQQNQNLKRQKDYLLCNIYKMQAKQRQYKAQLALFKQKCKGLQQENILLRERYQRAREFISSGIDKMQEVITKQQCQNISNSNTHHSNQNSIVVSQQIQQLNDKFDALMYQYQQKNNKSPQIRKKCIQIAKQLRRLRKSEQEGYLYKSKNSPNKNN